MRRRLRSWRPALRIARRDATRARGRSALVLVMIGLPVLAIVCLDTLTRTTDVSVREGLNRRLGSADALVTYSGATSPIDQDPAGMGYGSGPPDGKTLEPMACLKDFWFDWKAYHSGSSVWRQP